MVRATDLGSWVVWDLMALGPECVEAREQRRERLLDKKRIWKWALEGHHNIRLYSGRWRPPEDSKERRDIM